MLISLVRYLLHPGSLPVLYDTIDHNQLLGGERKPEFVYLEENVIFVRQPTDGTVLELILEEF